MSHIAIKIKDQYLVVPEDFSIDFEDVNPVFNDYESYTFDFQVPIESNLSLFKTIGDVRSSSRMMEFENLKAQIIVDGVPYRTGQLQTNEGEEIQDTVSMSVISSTRTIKDMVTDLSCRDIPVKDLIQIGEIVGDVVAKFEYDYGFRWKSGGKDGWLTWSSTQVSSGTCNDILEHKFDLQALGFSMPAVYQLDTSSTIEEAAQSGSEPIVAESFINVSDTYPSKPYCNAKVCYTHYRKKEANESKAEVSTSEPTDPYFVLQADRPQSGICFYVLYFLDCLFHYLDFLYDPSRLLEVGDMKRLAFFTTHCKYDTQRKYPDKGIPGVSESVEFDFNSLDEINRWLSSRKANGQLSFEAEVTKPVEGAEINGVYYKIGDTVDGLGELKKAEFFTTYNKHSVQANIMNMYANSDNFPDKSVSSVLDSLWASFGIRFMADYEKKVVTPVYIREVYRDQSEPIEIPATLISVTKVNEKVTGVRMKYSAESDKAEQQSNIRYNVYDYDTNYDYVDYRKVDASLDYLSIVRKNSPSDTTCYIDRTTGNAYRIKVSKDATTVSELTPAVFEVGAYKGVEVGDCSHINEDFVVEMVSDFEPVIMNDINGRSVKLAGDDKVVTMKDENDITYDLGAVNADYRQQDLAVFIDEEMNHENTEFRIRNTMGSNYADAYLTQIITTDESYDPGETEDGNSPLQHIDWGMAISIMRGGGSDAHIQKYDYDYDGNGNSKWRWVAGEYAMCPDCIDNWGASYDYNGEEEGIGADERFSLKIQAYKTIDGEVMCNDDERDENGRITHKVRSRGLKDTFMAEHIYFLLNRTKYHLRFYCEVSALANIQWARRYRIGEYIFWWDNLKYSVSAKTGLGVVSADVYSL